jgi:ankyrin repeat protein
MSKPPRAVRALPASPNLEQQKKQARELLDAWRAENHEALDRLRQHHPRFSGDVPIRSTDLALHDAQQVLAREYGFPSWVKLKEHIESISAATDPFELLARAVKADDIDSAKRILERHTGLVARLNDPMPGGGFGGTILGPAVEHQNGRMIELLLAHGADINQRSHWWAGSFGVLDACKPSFAPWLIEHGARVDAHAAARLAMLDRLDALVTADPSVVQSRGGDGQTPLHFAATIEVARYLLDHGANVDARDIDHESTPAQWMIRDRTEVARFLVEHGATADILMAAALGDVNRVREHLDRDPRSIHTRVGNKFFPMSNRQAGGTIYIWTLGTNKTAHTVARDFHHDDVYRFLLERSPEMLQFALACEIGDEATARAILVRRPNIVAELPPEEARRLGDAAWDGNTAAVRLMLDLGWPVNARNGSTTPLHQAAWTGNVENVRALIAAGADVNARDGMYNGTPIGWANHGAENNGGRGDPAAVIQILRAAGGKAPGELP